MKNETGILITAFNRPTLLSALLENLNESRFPIFVSLDVAKEKDLINEQLVAKCLQVVSDFKGRIAEIRVPEANQGCFEGVSQAISWGFTKVSRLIILEDDVLPGESFLEFADQMLVDFQDVKSVGSIGGTNLVPTNFIGDPLLPYRFSAYSTSWGWATWFDRWKDYENDLETFPQMDFENPRDFWSSAKTRYWTHVFKETASGVIDTWDYRWLYSNWKNSRLAIIPNANLVLNVGFGEDATHTRDKVLPWWLPIERNETYKVNITPRTLPRDSVADKWMETNHFRSNLRLQFRNQVSIKYPRISTIYKKYFKKPQGY